MSKATLVVMAAGIGSRFGGGIKQLEPIGPNGEIIMDYSVYDAMEAGFDKVVFVIRKDLEKDFKEIIGNRMEEKIEVAYAFQEKEDIPEPYKTQYADRKKPWGTGHAAESCTGGLIAQRLTAVPGSSEVFGYGFVTYWAEAKTRLVGVDPAVIDRYNVVSAPVAAQMAAGALEASGADIALSVTGIAGPSGGDEVRPVGTVIKAEEMLSEHRLP